MSPVFKHIASLLRKNTGRLALAATLTGTGLFSTAQAHERDVVEVRREVRVDARPVIEHRRWLEARFEERQSRIWVDPVYTTVAGPQVWVAPVYQTVVDRVWREPVVREDKVQVLIPAAWTEREVIVEGRHHKVHYERVLIPAHYEVQCQTVVVAPGHFDEVARQELVTAGCWQSGPDQQALVTAGHWDVRIDRICVSPAHFEECAVVVR